ncbi:hypothetical protein H1Z61_08980 [Bacillus aquiflavi]|uniref:Uncharacterized protein n=1 Tax=Bacillus aquiflavi TaxID=2672567 RepID=A0A6B3VU66_9BACI|nr:hypothetical protein [Bacillus aquiflavi]MBA4537272.1 hypothetical protein [Bacillus aquiflavi]NEY81529.1 hypothetical protein [Bacillus aquiflavi]UAC48694.1 hypothetical protein K6959_01545 [Bacillus aquiflavi]
MKINLRTAKKPKKYDDEEQLPQQREYQKKCELLQEEIRLREKARTTRLIKKLGSWIRRVMNRTNSIISSLKQRGFMQPELRFFCRSYR